MSFLGRELWSQESWSRPSSSPVALDKLLDLSEPRVSPVGWG